MKCPNCNAEISDSAKFCPECGSKIDQKRICSKCGAELSPTAKFCPECGTPFEKTETLPAQVEDELIPNNLFFMTQDNLQEAMGDEHILISIDSVNISNEKIADVLIDNDGDVMVIGQNQGNVKMSADFTYRGKKNRQQYSATIEVQLKIKADKSVEFVSFDFTNVNDEDGENSSDTWGTIGKIVTGAGALIGGFLQGYASAIDDDDDY